jgi:hypothetical protein
MWIVPPKEGCMGCPYLLGLRPEFQEHLGGKQKKHQMGLPKIHRTNIVIQRLRQQGPQPGTTPPELLRFEL